MCNVMVKSVKYLEGEHVYLRYLEPEDTEDFFTSDPEVRRLTDTISCVMREMVEKRGCDREYRGCPEPGCLRC